MANEKQYCVKLTPHFKSCAGSDIQNVLNRGVERRSHRLKSEANILATILTTTKGLPPKRWPLTEGGSSACKSLQLFLSHPQRLDTFIHSFIHHHPLAPVMGRFL